MHDSPHHRPTPAVCLDDLKLEIRAALDQSRRMGFRAIDVGAVRGPVSPEEMTRSAQRHFKKHLDDLGLRMSSLRGPTGGRGYADAAEGDRRLAAMRRIIALASEMRVPVVSTILCPGTPEMDDAARSRLHEALDIIASDSDRLGVTVAIETAGISTPSLKDMLSQFNCPTLVACCDSGAMLMQGEDPHRIADFLGGRIGLVRARDAIAGAPQAYGYEVAMGEGQLSPSGLLAALAESGYSGDLVMTRSSGTHVMADLVRAREAFERQA